MSAIPGPWEVVDIYDVQAGSLRIRQNYEPGAFDNGDLECAKDNAHLISAAPELLAACENVIRNIEAFSKREGHIPFGAAEVVSAIQKAKGES